MSLLCGPPPAAPPTITAGLSEAIAAVPWEQPNGKFAALCPDLSPCDTLWIEPRVVRLPHPAPVFFVPSARPTLLVLEGDPHTALPALEHWRLPIRYGDWGECRSQRHDPAWPTYRRACVAVGVAGDTVGDTLHLALLVLTPTRGLSWPRLRLMDRADGWRAELAWMGGE